MAVHSISHDPSTDQPIQPKTRVIELLDKQYEICSITAQCHTITALHTGAVRQFRSLTDLWGFVERLRWHLAYRQQIAAD